MINLNEAFKQMAKDFEIGDKEVLKSVRTMIRSAWSDSIFKTDFLNKQSILVENINPRSKKRFPKVRKYKCAICGGYFGSTEIELDHLVDENSLTSYENINEFFTNIILTSPDKLQVLCKDKKTKKSGVVHFGCHGIKTYASRYNVPFEQAKVIKYVISLDKENKVVDKLNELSVSYIPTTKAKRKALLLEILLKDLENKDV